MLMRAVIAATLAAALVGLVAGSPVTSAAVRNAGVTFTNVVASTPFTGGGYPVPPGSRVPVAGTCGAGPFNANQSESWIAVKPGTEDLVGSSKFFFDKYSTFYMFYLGSYRILNGAPLDDNQVQGYDCVSTGTQEMPPSWTDTTDPNADFDTQGRVYQTMLPFNSFFDATKPHPDAEIDVSYSDDNGRHWVKGNGGVALDRRWGVLLAVCARHDRQHHHHGDRRPPEHEVPRRDRREFRGQPDLSGASLPHL